MTRFERGFKSIEEMVYAAAAMVRPKEKLTVSQWAERYRYINNPGSYVGPWDNRKAPYLAQVMDALVSLDHTAVVFVGPARSGKALDCETPIRTPDGWTTMGRIRPGDTVFSVDGSPTQVLAVSEVMVNRDCYEVTFDCGQKIVADGEHRWAVRDTLCANNKVLTTAELLDGIERAKCTRSRYAIPLASPLNCKDADLPIDPYVLGMWLGDGSTQYGYLSCGGADVDNVTSNLSKRGYTWTIYQPAKGNSWFIAPRNRDGIPLINVLKTAGLGQEKGKFIPQVYLNASVEQRRELLRGLCDSDGSLYGKSGRTVQFCNSNFKLANQCIELVRSLGYKCTFYEKATHYVKNGQRHLGKPTLVVNFTTYAPEEVFSFQRKIDVILKGEGVRKRETQCKSHFIKSIVKVNSRPVRCIAVDHPTKLFLAGESMVPTHNSDIFFNWLGYTAHHDPADMSIYFMSNFYARDWSQSDLAKVLVARPPNAKRSIFEQLLMPGKQNRNIFDIRFMSGMRLNLRWPAITEVSGKTFPRGALNDYDHMEQDVAKMGSPFDLVRKRSTSFRRNAMTYAESTPAFPVLDPNWIAETPHQAPPVSDGVLKIYNQGDRRRWYWRCPECRESFEPDFDLFDYDIEAGRGDPVAIGRTVKMICPCCGYSISQEQRYELNLGGRWLKDGQTWDRDGVVHGDPPNNPTASFWLKGPAALFQDWPTMVTRYIQAMREFENTQTVSSLKATMEVDQGKPFLMPRDKTSRLPEDLMSRAEDWGGSQEEPVVPQAVRFLIATIDVQRSPPAFVVQVTGVGSGGDFFLIDAFKIRKSNRIDESDKRGDRAHIDPAAYLEDWDRLIEEVIEKTYPLADGSGRRMAIKIVGCDSGGQAGVTTNAYDFWRRLRDEPEGRGHHRRFHLIKGEGSKTGKDISKAPRRRRTYPDATRKDRHSGARGDVPLELFNADLLKDVVYARLGNTKPETGMIRFPHWSPNWIYTQLTNETRTNTGWLKKPGQRNETFDLTYYAVGLCLHPDIRLEHIDWNEPDKLPQWMRPWDENPLVIRAEEKNPLVQTKPEVIDLSKLAGDWM